MFDPANSTTYSNITCNSNLCLLVREATDTDPTCESSTCKYNQQYNDKSFSEGLLATETLTLTPSDVITSFVFGCSKNSENNDTIETAGLLGLGLAELSFVSQTAQKYGKYFSYCLPSTSSSLGHLTFGEQGDSSNVKFSPFSTSQLGSDHYFIDLIAINVAGTKLFFSPTDDTGVPMVIDSGTVVIRLPRMNYEKLRDKFKELMSMYPTALAPENDVIDTCYNFSDYPSFTLPNISLVFSGGVEIDMHESGILFGDSPSQMCLAFSGHDDFNFNFPILGNVQQKTMDIVYDVQGERIGFSAGGCA